MGGTAAEVPARGGAGAFVVSGAGVGRYIGAPASTPALDDVWSAWKRITAEADAWLNAVDAETLLSHVTRDGKLTDITYGSMLLRVIYHYWYHIGENMAIRQMLGQTKLPDFVGDLDGKAPYRAE